MMATEWTSSLVFCFTQACLLWATILPWTSGISVQSNPGVSHGAIIDAGSSGSRVRLYNWTRTSSKSTIPVYTEYFSYKIEPGISQFRMESLDGIRPYLEKLIDATKEQIPEEYRSETSIYLMATAGMRLLLEPRANAVMEEIQNVLLDKEFNPFRFEEHQARILSGEEEAAFAWIAANYLNGYFNDPDGSDSAGILELGGASTQIAFMPDGSILEGKFPLRLAGRHYPLYVQSYLYYGQNYAELWIKEYLHREKPNEAVVTNPCMLKGDNATTNISNTPIYFVGTGQPSYCAELVKELVYKVPSYNCNPKPCAVGSVYQPSVPLEKRFFALSAFTFPLRTLGVLDEDGFFTPEDTLVSAHKYCSRHIDDIIAETGRKRDFLSVECLMGLYIPVLFTRGYGFASDTRQVAAKFDINGQPAEWTLGAVIYESGRNFVNQCAVTSAVSMATTTANSITTTFYLTLLTIGFMLLQDTMLTRGLS